jgi:hypothetical protein
MSSKAANRIAQVFLFSAWLITICVGFTGPVNSQTCPYPRYMDPISIQKGSWAPMQVTVEVDSLFPDDQFNGLKAGNEQWNNAGVVACTGVTFLHFNRIVIQDYEETPPAGHLVWQRLDPANGKNGKVDAAIGSGGRVQAARIRILPTVPNVAQGTYFNYLGTHEVAHTFNLDDCVSTTGCPNGNEDTIMRGHSDGITSSNTFNTSGPKACDVAKVQAIYCPPCAYANTESHST